MVVGVDNNMRRSFFGEAASTEWNRDNLLREHGSKYAHYNIDIRDEQEITKIFNKYGNDIRLVIHTAAQPSHDWAARDTYTDFTVNASGTMVMLKIHGNFVRVLRLFFVLRTKCMEITQIPCRWSSKNCDGK
jgi:CDP-paratose 2-epimerase